MTELATIVIPTLNRPDLLSDCLRSIALNSPKDIQVEVEAGGTFAQNCNRGAAKARSDYLIFLNDDTVVQPNWLQPLIQPIPERAGITGAQLFYPDNTIQHAGIYFDAPGGILTAYNITWDEPSGRRDAVTGACMAVHRPLFESLNGFDEGYINGYEDVDLCLRARQLGVTILYVAESHVIHLESQSGAARWTHVQHNINRLQEKWFLD